MRFVAGGIGVGAKVADGYRGEPTRYVTLQARPFMRLDPKDARELAAELLDAATRAEALPILRCGVCGGLQPDHAVKRCKGAWVDVEAQAREPHPFGECATWIATQTTCAGCR